MFGDLFKKKPPKQEPAVIENDLGLFTMEYYDSRNTQPAYAYLGFVSWNDGAESHDVQVEVPCDGGGTFSADRGFELLRSLLADAPSVDRKIKEAALSHSVERDDGKVHTWGSSEDFPDGGEILSPDEFISRLSVDYMYLREGGEVSFILGLDDMYTDHTMEVFMDADGSVTDCGLVG